MNGLGIALAAGVGVPAVGMWRARHADFPAPLDLPHVVGVPLWRWADVHAWLVKTGRSS